MYEGQTVGVIVPAYNEAETVGTVLDHVPDYVDRIFAVDDCSTDETWEVITARVDDDPADGTDDGSAGVADDGGIRADGGCVSAGRVEQAQGRDDRIVPIRHEENQGAGGALKTGYRHAERAGMDLIVTLDADGQMDPAIMDRFLDPLVARKRAFSKGDRLASPEDRAAMPRLRLVGNGLLTYLTRIASGYWGLSDPQNGYTAITHDALAAIDVDALPDHHDYCNALLAQLRVADVEVIDVPMRAVYGDEESTIDFRSFVFRTSWTLARSYAWRLRQQYLTTSTGPIGRVRSALGSLSGRHADSDAGSTSERGAPERNDADVQTTATNGSEVEAE